MKDVLVSGVRSGDGVGRAFAVDVVGGYVELTLQPDQSMSSSQVLSVEAAHDLVDRLQCAIDGAVFGAFDAGIL